MTHANSPCILLASDNGEGSHWIRIILDLLALTLFHGLHHSPRTHECWGTRSPYRALVHDVGFTLGPAGLLVKLLPNHISKSWDSSSRLFGGPGSQGAVCLLALGALWDICWSGGGGKGKESWVLSTRLSAQGEKSKEWLSDFWLLIQISPPLGFFLSSLFSLQFGACL